MLCQFLPPWLPVSCLTRDQKLANTSEHLEKTLKPYLVCEHLDPRLP